MAKITGKIFFKYPNSDGIPISIASTAFGNRSDKALS